MKIGNMQPKYLLLKNAFVDNSFATLISPNLVAGSNFSPICHRGIRDTFLYFARLCFVVLFYCCVSGGLCLSLIHI